MNEPFYLPRTQHEGFKELLEHIQESIESGPSKLYFFNIDGLNIDNEKVEFCFFYIPKNLTDEQIKKITDLVDNPTENKI